MSLKWLPILIAPAVLAIACGGDSSSPPPASTPSSTVKEPPTMASPTPEATPTAPEALTVTGLFTDPRPTTPDTVRSLGTEPGISFAPWDGVSTVLYDTVTGDETNLGEGGLGAFSPDSTKMVWAAGPPFEVKEEVWLIDLSTMEKRSLGPGGLGRFVDDEHVLLAGAGGDNPEVVGLVTGERVRGDDVPLRPDLDGVTTPDGHVLREHAIVSGCCTPSDNNDYVLKDGETGRPLLEFRALTAAPAGHGELVLATPPANGTTNIFIVEIATGEATFIATWQLSPSNWKPLAANEQYVMWTDDFCGHPPGSDPPGRTYLYDRRTGLLTELEGSLLAKFTPGGLIAAGAFGARALIDPVTLEYVAVVPERAPGALVDTGGDVSWSPDYRYFTRGVSGGHGFC